MASSLSPSASASPSASLSPSSSGSSSMSPSASASPSASLSPSASASPAVENYIPTERLANIGYLGLGIETTPGVAVTPSDWIPLYDETMTTNLNLIAQDPIVGLYWNTYQTLQGQRDHSGKVTVMAEPNTAARLFDMLMTKGAKSGGSDPYTWPFTTGATTNSYTIDLAMGTQVFRFAGCRASQITHSYQNGNEMVFEVDISGLNSFYGRTLNVAPTGSNPYTIVFDTTYDPNPTTGLVVGDLMNITNAAGIESQPFVIASIVSGTTITTTTNVNYFTTGDIVTIRPLTPNFNNLTPFLWSNTQFCFGSSASVALTSAQTRLETGSQWTMKYAFENAKGSMRSGGFDPASLPRLQYGAEFKIKKFFDQPIDVAQFQAISKNACVIRHYSYTQGRTHELRVTLNNLKLKSGTKPNMKPDSILYSEEDYIVQYDGSDLQGADVKVSNSLSSV